MCSASARLAVALSRFPHSFPTLSDALLCAPMRGKKLLVLGGWRAGYGPSVSRVGIFQVFICPCCKLLSFLHPCPPTPPVSAACYLLPLMVGFIFRAGGRRAGGGGRRGARVQVTQAVKLWSPTFLKAVCKGLTVVLPACRPLLYTRVVHDWGWCRPGLRLVGIVWTLTALFTRSPHWPLRLGSGSVQVRPLHLPWLARADVGVLWKISS